MKKLLLVVAVFAVYFCVPCYAKKTAKQPMSQERQQELTAKMLQKQQLIDTQSGHHFGGVLTSGLYLGVGNSGARNGFAFFYGNRLTEHWMVGATAGAEFLTPATVSYMDSYTNNTMELRRPLMSFPVMGEVRLYFGASRFMPYLFTDLGVCISKFTGFMWKAGIGADINIADSHTIFVAVGLGTSPFPKMTDQLGLGYAEQTLRKGVKFNLNFKLGYYF